MTAVLTKCILTNDTIEHYWWLLFSTFNISVYICWEKKYDEISFTASDSVCSNKHSEILGSVIYIRDAIKWISYRITHPLMPKLVTQKSPAYLASRALVHGVVERIKTGPDMGRALVSPSVCLVFFFYGKPKWDLIRISRYLWFN